MQLGLRNIGFLGLIAIQIVAAFNGDWLDPDYYRRTRVNNELDWDWDRTWSGMSINNQPVSAILSHVLGNYKFTLPRIQIQRGQAYLGSSTRLRRVVRQLMRNTSPAKPVKIGVIGGSITWGQAVMPRGEADWFSILSKWLLNAFPAASITTRNGCTPGVPAAYMILCLELSVDPDVDLVFIEFTLNNGHDPQLYGNKVVTDMERLVRRVLALPNHPAVVLMHVPTTYMASYPPGHPKNPENETFTPFYATSEDAMGAVSQYYDVQALSLRSAMYDLAVRQAKDGFLWEQAFVDLHPGNMGHKLMADLAVFTLQQISLGLLQLPYCQDDEEAAEAPLSAPMYQDNIPPSSPMCIIGDGFRSLIDHAATTGWDYVNEGTTEKPKPGYVTWQPGSVLRLQVDTDRSGMRSQMEREKVHVFFHYLRSYEHMGKAEFRCVSGCTCSSREYDGHHEEKVSQLYMARMEVSQHPACVLEVEVSNTSSSGEHKFKVAGVVVSEKAGDGGIMDDIIRGGEQFGVREHNGDVMQITYTKDGRTGGSDASARRQ
ncbi:hypothetical protein VaNZ11_007873 [Volvox africanus]|uniref:SGNH hydrolase-type esterase domain-containing protein n=1 Tax=Volvox africanus TaxID=51714 RepID=A0ABQ5S4L3_9CHLO|nr:hypothetical protein VaNZ11_007873 [Volvox africanus]